MSAFHINFMRAAEQQDYAACQNMLRDCDGPSLCAYNHAGWSALTLAAKTRDDRILALFEAKGVTWDVFSIVAWGRTQALRDLIRAEPDCLRQNRAGTPLHWAMSCAQLPCAEVIVAAGISMRDDDGYVRSATFSGSEAAVDFAVAHGASVDYAPADSGQTALIHEAKHGRTKLIPALLRHGADPDRRDSNGLSAADYLRRRSNGARLLRDLLGRDE